MWPFKSKIPNLFDIKFDEEKGNLVLITEKGFFKLNGNDDFITHVLSSDEYSKEYKTIF